MGDTPSVMLVEDDLAIYDLYLQNLERRGHKIVFAAESGEQVAEAIAENTLPEADLAVVDYRLEGRMNGLDVAKLILQENPRTKVLMATWEDSITRDALGLGFLILVKPFAMSALNRMLEDILPLLPEKALPIAETVSQAQK
jgi:DNA-binding NtrC family response regulator